MYMYKNILDYITTREGARIDRPGFHTTCMYLFCLHNYRHFNTVTLFNSQDNTFSLIARKSTKVVAD